MNDEQRLEAIRAALSGSGESVARQALGAIVAHLEARDDVDAEEIIRELGDAATKRCYFGMVRAVASDIDDEVRERLRNGETTDDVNEWQANRIHEEADGSYWTIYTHANFRALYASDNWDAAVDQGMAADIDDTAKMFAVMTYCALYADLCEQVTDVDDLVEGPVLIEPT
jgi:hypothetical protein